MTLKRRKRTVISEQRAGGQATVELAIIFTFLALLLAGIADVARIYSEHLAVVHAAGVGARWLTLDPDVKSCSGYTTVQEPIVADLGSAVRADHILSIQTPVSIETPVGSNAFTVTKVMITYRHDFLFGLVQNVSDSFTGSATWAGSPTI